MQQSKKSWHIVSEEAAGNYNGGVYGDGWIKMRAGRSEEDGVWCIKVMITLLPPWQQSREFQRKRKRETKCAMKQSKRAP